MSQILSHPIESTSPSQVSFDYTVDDTFTTFTKPFEIDPISSSDKNRIAQARLKGFNRQFKPKLHDSIPELRKLTDEELEDLIGERNRDDFDDE
jgi:hypothetical protein